MKRAEPLKVLQYATTLSPSPSVSPQHYQVIGRLAKSLTKEFKIPVVSDGSSLQVLGDDVLASSYKVTIEDVGAFSVNLSKPTERKIESSAFDDYRRLVGRIVDLSLVEFSTDYYKFHEQSPYILRDEAYFEQALISMTGIIDSKKYYRGLNRFDGRIYLQLNRETELRSYHNLLSELRCLKNKFESRGKKFEFNHPPREFVDYVNMLFRGKSADVIGYPGPRVRYIERITWSEKDRVKLSRDYLLKKYGLSSEAEQPGVIYRLDSHDPTRTQMHLPQVLSIGHDFEDLERRIPKWQRSSVWSTIQPDCKNQLAKIHEIAEKIDSTLRREMPTIYPSLVEFDLEEADITQRVASPREILLQFQRNSMKVKPPYDISFYQRYSDKKVLFADPTGPVSIGLLNSSSSDISKFVSSLQEEHQLRNGEPLSICNVKDLERDSVEGLALVMTVGNDADDGFRETSKRTLQHTFGIPHQHVTVEHAEADSVMALIMQLCLKLGHNPWLLQSDNNPRIVSLYGYRPPTADIPAVFWNEVDSRGRLLTQDGPFDPTSIPEILKGIGQRTSGEILVIYNGLRDIPMNDIITANFPASSKWACVQIFDTDNFRFFETWKPPQTPVFGKVQVSHRASVEAHEMAPQGSIAKMEDVLFYLVTGRTIERNSVRRGCPTPIKAELKQNKTSLENDEIIYLILQLCMMGRESGHMTRWPMPLYYLRMLAGYVSNYGWPHENIKQRPFYV
jgi:hypothetical protein